MGRVHKPLVTFVTFLVFLSITSLIAARTTKFMKPDESSRVDDEKLVHLIARLPDILRFPFSGFPFGGPGLGGLGGLPLGWLGGLPWGGFGGWGRGGWPGGFGGWPGGFGGFPWGRGGFPGGRGGFPWGRGRGGFPVLAQGYEGEPEANNKDKHGRNLSP